MQYRYQKLSLLILSVLFSSLLLAQPLPLPRSVRPMELHITCDQTSVLLFPAAIKKVDRGSADVLTKTVEDISNVLKVKAASDTMKATNLHVFTADEQVYAFTVRYHPLPQVLTINFTEDQAEHSHRSTVAFQADRLNDAQVIQYASLISELEPQWKRPRSKKIGDARLTIQGAYYVKGMLFFQLALINTAPVPYHINFTRTYVRDRKKSKRTSVTEKEMLPQYHCTIPGEPSDQPQQITLVVAFEQFTIADSKYLSIEVFERNGDRALACRLKGKDILRAKKLLAPPPTLPKTE